MTWVCQVPRVKCRVKNRLSLEELIVARVAPCGANKPFSLPKESDLGMIPSVTRVSAKGEGLTKRPATIGAALSAVLSRSLIDECPPGR